MQVVSMHWEVPLEPYQEERVVEGYTTTHVFDRATREMVDRREVVSREETLYRGACPEADQNRDSPPQKTLFQGYIVDERSNSVVLKGIPLRDFERIYDTIIGDDPAEVDAEVVAFVAQAGVRYQYPFQKE